MKKQLIAAVFSLAPLIAAASGETLPASPYVSSQPGIEVSVRHAKEAGVFEVFAKISDPATGESFAGAGMFVRAGQWVTHSIPANGKRPAVELAATVDPSGELAAFSGREMASGKAVHSYSGTVLVTP